MSRKYTLNEVKMVFAEAGYELLSNCYENAHQLLLYRCPAGHEEKVRLYSFQHLRSRCPACAGVKRLTYETVKQAFEDAGLELMDVVYVNSATPIQYRCVCGEVKSMLWSSFQRGQRRCRSCWFELHKGENHPFWNPDKEQMALLRKVYGQCYSALKTTLKTLGKKKEGKTRLLLGYTNKELLEHLQRHPSWESLQGKRWSLDHIFPIKAFVEYGITDVRLINCLDNLQPMLSGDNCAKNDSYNKEAFLEWLQTRRKE